LMGLASGAISPSEGAAFCPHKCLNAQTGAGLGCRLTYSVTKLGPEVQGKIDALAGYLTD